MSLEAEAYEQNYQQFRSLNQIMWQIPVLAMTLTGGLWFGVSKIEDNRLLASLLLLTAVVGNLTLSVILYRFRFVMRRYLAWLRDVHPDGFVDASEPDVDMGRLARFFVREERVRQMFSFLLYWAAGASLVLLVAEAFPWGADSSEMEKDRGIEFYDSHATALADGYEAIFFEDAYPFLVALFSGDPLEVLDIGSGTGRDAGWIAERGHKVVAVEPSFAMRKIASSLHKSDLITWVDARLPTLQNQVLRPDSFDVILANAVWMHVRPEDRPAAMVRMFELLHEDGRAFVSLRLGPQDEKRGMYAVFSEEFEETATRAGFSVIHHGDFPDLLGRSEVMWKMYELQK
ncbi:class I SAM-dependent methyltransferase [Thioclava pacifica]|uniref:Methyltransferase type 11 domain-containing protein n=1 Tax=Thioclava pacifica DSM 10166 TaxID=1353537 RepID=A0A074JFM4_9RHOB|nr:class I SAM-dependent methyltransferase [Thioclava pacifica]KEO54660.1 hypothetical protein TP2_17475 [Thioclava pacifica DSM 10166]